MILLFEQQGVSFVHHPDNGLKDKLGWMLTQVEQTEQGHSLQSSGQWSIKQIKQQVNRFLALLHVCAHVTSGQPGRGPEISTMRHHNGLLQDRNIFIMDGKVMTVV